MNMGLDQDIFATYEDCSDYESLEDLKEPNKYFICYRNNWKLKNKLDEIVGHEIKNCSFFHLTKSILRELVNEFDDQQLYLAYCECGNSSRKVYYYSSW